MKKLLVIFITLVSVSSLWAQPTIVINKPFNQVVVRGGFEVVCSSASENGATISYESTQPQVVRWNVSGETLTISMQKGILDEKQKITVNLSIKDVARLTFEGATVTSTDQITCRNLDLEVGGSVNKVALNLNTENLKVNLNGYSNVTLTGIAARCDIRALMGSKIDCSKLEVTYADVISNQKSEVLVWATTLLIAKATMGGNVFYLGDPELRTKTATTGAVVKITAPN